MSVNPSPTTVPAVARHYGVSQGTVHSWIESGALVGINVARGPRKKKAEAANEAIEGGEQNEAAEPVKAIKLKKKRPRWYISPEALEQFERIRSSRPEPQVSRRRRKPQGVIQFYP